MEDTNPINGFITNLDDDTETLESLSASFTEEPSPSPKKYSESEWRELQRSRLAYLKEWEEDMRYAQELASEGM